MREETLKIIKNKDQIQSELGAVIIEIETMEQLELIKNYLEALKERELLSKELKIVQKKLEYSCDHLWYIMDKETNEAKCLSCFKMGYPKKDETVIGVYNPTYIDLYNKDSFMFLFTEYQDELYNKGQDDDFVRKYVK